MLGKEDLRSFSEGRSFLPSSMGLVLLAAVVFVPWWWLRLVQRAGSILGHHWIPVLLLALGLSGISVRASGWRRRLRSDNTRLTRRRPLAERLPLFIHVAGMLFFAVSAAAVLGLGLWAALGRPSVVLRPGVGWTVANTFDAIKIVLAVVAGIGGVVALTVRYREQDLTEAAERREDTKLLRVIQNSVTKIANGPLTCADSGGEMPAEGVLNNPRSLNGSPPPPGSSAQHRPQFV